MSHLRVDADLRELASAGRHAGQPRLAVLAPEHSLNHGWRALLARVVFAATVLYAGTLVWIAPHPPMADLPQHAAQVALLRDLLLGHSPWEPLLRINYFTPYLIGYGLALPLTAAMPVAAALKVLLTLAFYCFVLCCVLLRRRFQGDERLDWLFIPGFFGFAYAWGFFTFLLATPVALLFVLLADKYAERPATARGVLLFGAGLVLFFSHGLVFLFACSIAIALLLIRSSPWKSTLAALLPFVPLGALSLVYAFASLHRDAVFDQWPSGASWEWLGRLNLIANIFGTKPYDVHDAVFAVVAGSSMLFAPRLLQSSVNRSHPAVFIPIAAALLVWLAAPNYAMKADFVYQRFAIFILPFYALIFCRPALSPAPSPADRMKTRLSQLLLPSLCWVFLLGQTDRLIDFARESRDFEFVRAAVEPGQRALWIALESDSVAAKNIVAYLHYPLWYQAENGGFVDFNFAWAPSQMIRFRSDQLPAAQPFWRTRSFSWALHEGWIYRYFFVRHFEPLPSSFFENDRCEVSLLKSAGSWSVYESKRCRWQ